jgi:hypothetical protein
VADRSIRTERRARPFGVTVIVVLLLVAAVVALPSSLIGLRGALRSEGGIAPLPDPTTIQLIGALMLLLAIAAAALAAAVGLVRLRRWAWVLTMLMVGTQMAANLWEYVVAGERPYVEMLLDVVLVFYLNQREVQRAFGHRAPRDRLLDAPISRAR